MTNEELKKEIEKLKQEIIKLRFNQLESKAEPIPTSYQVKIPADLENYYTLNIKSGQRNIMGVGHLIGMMKMKESILLSMIADTEI